MEYIPVRVSTLRGDEKILFDLYVPINQKYIHFMRQGDSFEGTRLTRLKKKKLKKMYIVPEHEKAYQDYVSRNIEMAYDKSSGKSIEVRAEIIQGNNQTKVEEVTERPEDHVAYGAAKDNVSKYVDFLVQDNDAIQAVLAIENTDKDLAHHGVTVSTIAVHLAKKLGVTDEEKIRLLALGASLHDIGHSCHDVSVQRSLSEFSPEELATYKSHATLGVDKVRALKHFDAAVVNIIAQHEELCNGSGYPQGLQENAIDQLALITGVANCLDRYVTFEGISKEEAVKKILVDKVGLYPLNYIQSLRGIFK